MQEFLFWLAFQITMKPARVYIRRGHREYMAKKDLYQRVEAIVKLGGRYGTEALGMSIMQIQDISEEGDKGVYGMRES